MKTKRRYTGPTEDVLEAVRIRSRGYCELCGDFATQVHHRRPRGLGGTRDPQINLPSNLLHVCLGCHGYIEAHRAEALTNGWLVSRYGGDPAEAPVLIDRDSRWVNLTIDGEYAS